MKVLIAIVAVAALGAVVGAIYIGHRISEPTVVPDPYEAGLRYDESHHAHDAAAVGPRAPPTCDLAKGPCARTVDGATVTLDVAPRPPRTMRELDFTVDVRRGALPVADRVVEIALAMPGMYMGENRVRLALVGDGRYRGRGVIVRCPSGRRGWTADVTVAPREPDTAAPLRATFAFEVTE